MENFFSLLGKKGIVLNKEKRGEEKTIANHQLIERKGGIF